VSLSSGVVPLARHAARLIFTAASGMPSDGPSVATMLASLGDLEPVAWYDRPAQWIQKPLTVRAQEGPYGPTLVRPHMHLLSCTAPPPLPPPHTYTPTLVASACRETSPGHWDWVLWLPPPTPPPSRASSRFSRAAYGSKWSRQRALRVQARVRAWVDLPQGP
jgi:hypothetical protein